MDHCNALTDIFAIQLLLRPPFFFVLPEYVILSLKRNHSQFYPALISASDTLSVRQSKWNELGQTGVLPTNCAKQRKVAICTLLPQEPASNDDDWAAPKFPPFWPLFAAIPSTLILTLPLACLWDPTTERKVIRRQSFLVLLLSLASHKFDSLFLSFLIYFGGCSILPHPSDCHLIKKFHFLPKMETSPSSLRINQTWGEEKWKCENRKSQLGNTKCERKNLFLDGKGELLFERWWEMCVAEEILVWWALSGGRGSLWPLIEKFPDHCHWLLLPSTHL